MTLDQWEGEHGLSSQTPRNHPDVRIIHIADVLGGSAHRDLYNLSDYLVMSASAGSIWLRSIVPVS